MLSTLHNRMSALLSDPIQAVFNDFDRGYTPPATGAALALRSVAPLSIWEDGNSVHVELEVPGIALADLDVSVENRSLTIRGERKAPERPSGVVHEERFYGQFERTIGLGEWVDASSIEASLRDGVLHLTFAKKAEAQRQRVAINYGGTSDSKRIETSSQRGQ